MNMMGNTTSDLMVNWMACGGVMSAQDVKAAANIEQDLSAAAHALGNACYGMVDSEIRNAAMSVSPPTCDLFTDPKMSAA
ncbi:hypothetical protein [Thalassospira sp.]|uniref:hypothetical protein n=1 Tax=Thalassospira sp. TaxID=1912094 RepID=UPI003AA9DF3A